MTEEWVKDFPHPTAVYIYDVILEKWVPATADLIDVGLTSTLDIQVAFQSLENILMSVLKEVKIMNLHMSLITDMIINKTEVE